MVLGKGEDMPSNSMDGTKGDLLVPGSNQRGAESLMMEWMHGWLMASTGVEISFLYSYHHWPSGARVQRHTGARRVRSFPLAAV